MSLESVVSLIGGFLFLQQYPTRLELLGSIIMYVGVFICIMANKNK